MPQAPLHSKCTSDANDEQGYPKPEYIDYLKMNFATKTIVVKHYDDVEKTRMYTITKTIVAKHLSTRILNVMLKQPNARLVH